jgi:hypothetical protein
MAATGVQFNTSTGQYGWQGQAPYGFVSSKKLKGPDPVLVKEQLLGLQHLLKTYGKAKFSEEMFWILRKNPEHGEKDLLPKDNRFWNRRLIPFKHNRIQLDLDQNMGTRNIMLKPRQAGYTTYILIMRMLLPVSLEPGVGGLIISQNYHYVASHFAMLHRAFKHYGVVDPFDQSKNIMSQQLHQHLLHTTYSNRRELIFDQLDSRILCESAENEEAGQGVTVQHVTADEVARWPGIPEETLANLKEAIPKDGTLDLLSTANGWGGYFFEECMRARKWAEGQETEFKYFFHQWWWHDEYRDDKPVAEKSLSEEEKLLHEKFLVDLNQLAWRRKKMVELRHNFAEKYPEDDITCFLLQGRSYFDKQILRERWMELKDYKPYETFERVQIFKPRVKGKRYLIAGDVATGRQVSKEDSDFCAAVVIDLETAEEVAAYHARVAPEQMAFDLDELGRLYNDALIAIERTGDGGTTIFTLEVMCQYTNLYKHKDWWRKDRKNKQIVEILGFPTSTKTRPVMLNRLAWVVLNQPELIMDQMAVQEMLTFVINEKGKPEAEEGCHDDRVMCRAIALMCRMIVLGYLDPLAVPRERYGATPTELQESADEA